MLGAVLGLTVLLALLVTAFAWPATQIRPRDLPVAVAGPEPAVLGLEQALTANVGEDAIDLRIVGDREAAVAAINNRDVYGAILLGPDGAEVLTASAASPAVAQLLTGAAQGLAAQAGEGTPPPVVTDVVPLPDGDPRGLVFAAGSLPFVIGGIASGALLLLAVATRRAQLLGIAGVAAAAGLTLTALLQHWLGALGGDYLTNAAVVALAIAAVALPVLGLGRLLGPAGIGLGAALILLLGNPFSGLTSAPELLPAGWSTIGQLMPPGALGQALRSTAFFDGAGAAGPLWVLTAWVAAGALLAVIGRRGLRQH